MWNSNIEAYAARHSMSVKQALHLKCTGEHLVAHSDGGTANQENIVAACRYCNSKRHARKRPLDPESFARFVQKRLEKRAWNTHLFA